MKWIFSLGSGQVTGKPKEKSHIEKKQRASLLGMLLPNSLMSNSTV